MERPPVTILASPLLRDMSDFGLLSSEDIEAKAYVSVSRCWSLRVAKAAYKRVGIVPPIEPYSILCLFQRQHTYGTG